MADPVCKFHPDVKAHRLVPKVGGLCDACFRAGPPYGPPPDPFVPERKNAIMAKKNTSVDWPAILQAKEAGIPAADLANKYGVSVANIYYHASSSSKKKRGGGRSKASNGVGHSAKSSRFASSILELTAERDRIQAIISQLELMG
jgi:hypothetical protein